jgi:hypothetical protein
MGWATMAAAAAAQEFQKKLAEEPVEPRPMGRHWMVVGGNPIGRGGSIVVLEYDNMVAAGEEVAWASNIDCKCILKARVWSEEARHWAFPTVRKTLSGMGYNLDNEAGLAEMRNGAQHRQESPINIFATTTSDKSIKMAKQRTFLYPWLTLPPLCI